MYKDGEQILKHRAQKTYRHPEIDAQLRKARTRREAKVLEKLSAANIPAPKLVSMDDKDMKLAMSLIPGDKLRDVLETNALPYAFALGELLGKMHKQDIIHGDLTTSNVIVSNNKLHAIDFGLSFFSTKIEDKATDFHVLLQALQSRHYAVFDQAAQEVEKGYAEAYPDASLVLKQLEKVESRGRNKKLVRRGLWLR